FLPLTVDYEERLYAAGRKSTPSLASDLVAVTKTAVSPDSINTDPPAWGATVLPSVEYPVHQRILTYQFLPFSFFSFYALYSRSVAILTLI
ncbi:hypothetical protein, partial [Cylindrospermopsis raciborskii]|uniref:hypothetical protein n=1 Tax=Cylindrospermopsis raciborskii TaxID=77022 RepID=UPI0038CF9C9B